MSRSNAATVSFDERIELSPAVAAAYRRTFRCLTSATAFVDRAQAVGSILDEIIAWRFAGTITNEQCSFLLRHLRSEFARYQGEVTEREFFSAEEADQNEAMWAARDVDVALAAPGSPG